MKKVLSILICTIITSVLLQAQTEKGTILLGTTTSLVGATFSLLPESTNNAGISFGSTKFKSDSFESESEGVTAFNLAPKVGFFVVDGVLIGIDLGFAYLKGENDDDPVTGINFGPFFRYYFSTANFRPFAQAQIGIGQVSFGPDDNDKTNILNYGGGVGGAIFVGEKVAIDLMAAFNHQQGKDKGNSNNAKSIANLFGLVVGVSVFL